MERKKLGLCEVKCITERELSIMRLLAKGDTYMEVAETLFISHDTVKHHVKRLLAKTGYRNSVALVAHAVEGKVIRLEK